MSLSHHEQTVSALENRVNALDPGYVEEPGYQPLVSYERQWKFKVWYLFGIIPVAAVYMLIFKPKLVCTKPDRRDKNGKVIWKISWVKFWLILAFIGGLTDLS